MMPGRDLRLAVALGFSAFTVRLAALLLSFEIPGDGPTRAILAHDWSLAPRLETHGVWMPGFNLLAGPFAWLVPDPLVSTRILNLLLGSLTIPLFYYLVSRIHGTWPALFSASVMVVLPLHVGLSATSLTEATFLFLVVASMLLFVEGSREQPHQRIFLAGAILVFSLAEMTRYEAWIFLPAFGLYYLLATRRVLASLVVTILLSAFPLVWTLGNYLHYGQPLLGFSAGVRGTESGPKPATLVRAVYALAVPVAIHTSWFLAPLALVGLVLELARGLRRQLRLEATFYLLVFGIYSLVMVIFVMARGAIWDRNILLGLVFGLPYAALPLAVIGNLRLRACAAITLIGLSAVLAPSVLLAPRPPEICLTRERPQEIIDVAAWLRRSSYHASSILLTKMEWKSTYFFLYAPEFHPRSMVFSFWIPDYELRNFIDRQAPSILITSESDDTYLRHVERFLPHPIRTYPVLYTTATTLVYDISR